MNSSLPSQVDLVQPLPQATANKIDGKSGIFPDTLINNNIQGKSEQPKEQWQDASFEGLDDNTYSFWAEVSDALSKPNIDKETPAAEIKPDKIPNEISTAPVAIESLIKPHADAPVMAVPADGLLQHMPNIDMSETVTPRLKDSHGTSLAALPKDPSSLRDITAQKNAGASDKAEPHIGQNINTSQIKAENAETIQTTAAPNHDHDVIQIDLAAEKNTAQQHDKTQYHKAHSNARQITMTSHQAIVQTSLADIAATQNFQTLQVETAQAANITAPLTTTAISTNPAQFAAHLNFSAPHNPNLKIINHAIIQARETMRGIQVQLDPPEMGRVMVDFIYESDQSLKVVIKAESLDAQLQLRQHSDILLTSLRDSGLDNISLDFQMNSNAFQDSNKDFTPGNHHFRLEAPAETETEHAPYLKASPQNGRLDLIL